MMVFVLFVLGLALGGVLGKHFMELRSLEAAEKTFTEFRRLFPGMCPLCSYDRWGRHMGYSVSKARPHPCPEGNSLPMPEALRATWGGGAR
jgi:hypothetical protein